MIFDGYTKDDTGVYMALISEVDDNKTVLINLLDIEFVEEFDTDGRVLQTKDDKVYFLDDRDKKIEKELPNGFKWNKRRCDSKKWYDPQSGFSGYDDFYRLTLVNKLEGLLSNPEILLNKLKKACEDAEV